MTKTVSYILGDTTLSLTPQCALLSFSNYNESKEMVVSDITLYLQ